MADITISFMHPRDGRVITATVDDSITAHEAIGELLAANFVTPHEQGYELANNGIVLRGDQTLAEAGATNGSKILIVPVAEGGGPKKGGRTRGEVRVPGLDKKSFRNVSLEEIHSSPEAVTLILHFYNDLQIKYEKLSSELDEERSRSRNRFTATLLLLISQVVLAIGANLLTSSKPAAIPVLIAGGCQVALALYLTFWKS